MFLFFVVHLATTISVIFNGWRSWASESGKSDAERNANQAMPAPKRHTNKSPTAAVPAAGCPHFECHRVATIPIQFVPREVHGVTDVGTGGVSWSSGSDGTAFDKSLRQRHVKSPPMQLRCPILASLLPPDTCATCSSWQTTLLLPQLMLARYVGYIRRKYKRVWLISKWHFILLISHEMYVKSIFNSNKY